MAVFFRFKKSKKKMKKIGLYLFILLFPVSVSANNYEQIGDKRQSIEINNFFSDVKKEILRLMRRAILLSLGLMILVGDFMKNIT